MDKKSIHQEVTDTILASLEKGTLPWRKPWKTQGGTSSYIPANGITGRPYQGINRLILWASGMAKGYPSHAWATFRQVSQAGGHVRKGEKGTHVVLYRPLVANGEAGANEQPEATETQQTEQGQRGERPVRILRAFTVFNLAQCEGLPQSPEPVVPPVDAIPAAQRYLANVGASVQHGGDRAFYSPHHDRIQLPSFDAFSSAEAYFATSCHEHVHWTGAESRLKRLEKGARFGSQAYAYEELVAELGAAFLCADLNIRGELEHHASYLQHWLGVLRQDSRALFSAAADANRATEYLGTFQPRACEHAA